jgi:hypothetical protein
MPRYGLQTGAAAVSGILESYNRSLALQADLENYKDRQKQDLLRQQSRDLRDRLAVRSFNLRLDNSIAEARRDLALLRNSPEFDELTDDEKAAVTGQYLNQIRTLESSRFMPFANDGPSGRMPMTDSEPMGPPSEAPTMPFTKIGDTVYPHSSPETLKAAKAAMSNRPNPEALLPDEFFEARRQANIWARQKPGSAIPISTKATGKRPPKPKDYPDAEWSEEYQMWTVIRDGRLKGIE